MRAIFLLGGFVGFSVVLLSGWLAERSMNSVLRDAAIGCLVMALLFRWVWSLIVKAFYEAAMLRKARLLQAQLEAEEAEEAAKAKTKDTAGRPSRTSASAAARSVSTATAVPGGRLS